jgi:hypothetical protein
VAQVRELDTPICSFFRERTMVWVPFSVYTSFKQCTSNIFSHEVDLLASMVYIAKSNTNYIIIIKSSYIDKASISSLDAVYTATQDETTHGRAQPSDTDSNSDTLSLLQQDLKHVKYC